MIDRSWPVGNAEDTTQPLPAPPPPHQVLPGIETRGTNNTTAGFQSVEAHCLRTWFVLDTQVGFRTGATSNSHRTEADLALVSWVIAIVPYSHLHWEGGKTTPETVIDCDRPTPNAISVASRHDLQVAAGVPKFGVQGITEGALPAIRRDDTPGLVFIVQTDLQVYRTQVCLVPVAFAFEL